MNKVLSSSRRHFGAAVRTLLHRSARLLIVLWGAATVAFLMLALVPGDPVEVILGPLASTPETVKDQIREELGLNLPLWQQYFAYLGRLLTFDLGVSYQLRQDVATVIGQQLWPTVQLTALASIFALGTVLLLAIFVRRGWGRTLVGMLELVAASAPVFWTGLMLAAVFSYQLGWLPVLGAQGPGALILPAITIALPVAAVLSQVLRQGIEVAEEQSFALTARARGLSSTQLVLRHTLRHAAGNALSLAGFLVGNLLAGAVVVETLFARPGLGRVTLSAVAGRDLPVVMGLVVLSAAVFAVVMLVVESLLPVLDARLRRGEESA